MRPGHRRTVYVPCMSDHAYAVAGAMRGLGVPTQVLRPPDAESLAIGLRLCRGRECLPCFLCVGDFLRACRAPGFDPRSAVLFMPTGPGPCRFGQYRVLQKAILEDEGFGAVELVSPTTEDSYTLFGDHPLRLRARCWEAIIAVDLLTRALHERRPYETEPGRSEAAYQDALADVVTALEAGGGARLRAAMRAAAGRFASVETDSRRPRPLVAVMGELYLMLNRFGNLELVRAVERAGGEVLQGTFGDWLHFVDWCRRERARRLGLRGERLKALVTDLYQRWIERGLWRALGPALHHPPEAPVARAMEPLRACYEPSLGTEATLTMGRVLDVARHGVSGIINVLPFSCMPGNIVVSMAPRLRRQLNGIPWLDVAFDGQQETNLHTRLEAFMHQAFQFHQRALTAKAGAP